LFYDGVVDAQGTVGSGQARGLPSGQLRQFVTGGSTRTERHVRDYFDDHGRLIQRRTQQDLSTPAPVLYAGQRSYTHRWVYDTRFGRVLAESWPNGVGRSFVYSSIGAVEAELGLGDAMPLTLREVREVNALGQATEEWLGSPGQHGALRIQRTQTLTTGEMESIHYARRATGSASPASVWHETYRYDGWGNLIRRGQSQSDLPTAGGSFSQFERYRYDALHRLTQSVLTTNGVSASPVELGYDTVGNLRKKTDFSQNVDSAYSYPAATAARPNAVQSVALASVGSVQNYGHDASGNVVCQFVSGTIIGRSCGDQHSFRAHYNHNQQPVYQERLLGVENSIGSYSTAWFTYGADQQPARQWGFEGTPDCGQAAPNNKPCLRHHRIYLDRYEDTVGTFTHFDGGVRQYRTRAYIGDYLVATRGRYGELELSFLLRDRLGSVVGVEGVTLRDRNIVEMRAETRHSFDAYGAPRSNFKRVGSVWSEQPRWSAPTRTQQGFTGHERLSGLQLIHMRGRVFDPQLGRFHGVDPIIQFPLSSQGLNPYSYILNNPLAGVDPTGYAVPCRGSLPGPNEVCTEQVEVEGSGRKDQSDDEKGDGKKRTVTVTVANNGGDIYGGLNSETQHPNGA
jgi:RHS repeat-associated protein